MSRLREDVWRGFQQWEAGGTGGNPELLSFLALELPREPLPSGEDQN